MKKIDIYIHTLTHSRGRGPAVYKAVLEFIRSNGTPYTLEIDGFDLETTRNRITIQAAVMAMRRIKLNETYEIRIHAGSDYFARMLKGTEIYAQHEWKTAAGKEIANADLWKQIYIFTQTNKVTADTDRMERYECKKELEEKLCSCTN